MYLGGLTLLGVESFQFVLKNLHFGLRDGARKMVWLLSFCIGAALGIRAPAAGRRAAEVRADPAAAAVAVERHRLKR